MDYFTELLHWTLFTLLLSSCAYHLLCIRGVSSSLCIKKADKHSSPYTPPISVLKPVCGLERSSRDCFASFCRQSYPNYEVIFAVQDENDPAIAVIEQLIVDYPDRNIKLVVNPASIGTSGKLSNLENALQQARHQILVISDSDILVDSDYLKNVVAPFYDREVGLVTCLYRASQTRTLGALLEAVGISGEFLPGVCAALHLEGLRFALGATIAMRRDVLEQIGGFKAIADYLGDDYLLGKLTADAGYRLAFCDSIVETVLPDYTLSEFFSHQMRWARNLRCSRPAGYLGMLITHTTAFILLSLIFYPGSLALLLASIASISARFYSAWRVGVRQLCDPNLLHHFAIVPIRDLVWFVIWLLSFFGSTVVWRGQRFRVTKGGRLVMVTKNSL